MSPEKRNRLLTSPERAACQQIAAGAGPHSQRAAALLALDEGVTQAEAGRRAGLSRGQLWYWLTKFRQQRLDIFPPDLLGEMLRPLSVTEVEEGPRQETELAQPPGDVIRAKKAKKAKGDKKKRRKKAKRKPKKAEKKPVKVKRVVKTKKAKKAEKAKGGKRKQMKKAKKRSKKAKGNKA